MKCTNPIIGIPEYINQQTGKMHYHIASMAKTIHGYRTFEDWKNHFCKVHPGVEPIKIPCGRCLACQINKANDWSNRIMLEKEDHEHSYFITLTYDDDHLVDYEGNPLVSPALPSLYKKHLQDF